MNSDTTKIIVALSGGVDSAACACLLRQKHSNLQAVYMRNWDRLVNNDFLGAKTVTPGCADAEDLEHVRQICQQLNLPLKVYNFVAEYWDQVFVPNLNSIKTGRTPNPDVVCNQKIKFGVLLEKITADFGAGVKIATGHYARIERNGNRFFLKTAINQQKDQTYFLHRLTQVQLARIVFPLGEIASKNETRAIARQHNLAV